MLLEDVSIKIIFLNMINNRIEQKSKIFSMLAKIKKILLQI